MRQLSFLLCFAATILAHFSMIAQPPGEVKKTTDKPVIKDNSQIKIRQQKTKVYSGMDSVYLARTKLEKIDDVYIPRDLYDAFRELDKLMEPEVRKTFMAFSDEEVDRRTHASLGKWIEHKWSLTEGSRLSAYFTKMKVPHHDHMVGIIITSYHRHLHKKDLKVKEQVDHFRKIWEKKQREEAKKMLKGSK